MLKSLQRWPTWRLLSMEKVARDLLCEFCSGIDHSGLLKIHQLEGLAQLIQGPNQDHLSADDLVKILGLLFVGFFDGNISVYLTSTWERTRMLSGHNDMVRRIVFSSKGDQIASASYDTTVQLWDRDTGSQLHVLQDHKSVVYGVAYSPKGDLVASGAADMTVRIWDVASRDCRK
ncbi:hypothetical protein BGX34_002841, partial [Mortierella sp. NVP85]